MADARTLLRQQQATRRITSPHALYTPTGKLTCALCRAPVKTEALWDAHARSAPHRAALQSQSQARAAKPAAGTKRKLSEEEDTVEGKDDRRKRGRTDVAPPALTPASSSSGSRASNTPSHGVELSIPSRPATPKTATAAPTFTGSRPAEPVDEAEWAAFEADIAAATAPYSEDAVISAPAMPAGGEPGEEEEERREDRNVEMEAEREEAERALGEEFDEMGVLEARARRLKERRETLRARSRADLRVEAVKGLDKENAEVEEEEEEESDEEEEEDDYAWGGLRHAGRA